MHTWSGPWGFFSERQHRCCFSFPSKPDHNVGVICKNLHQDIHCKLLQKNLLKKLDFLAQLELYYSKYSILTYGQTPLTGGKDKSCWSKPVKVVKTSSTFLPSCWLSAPSVTVVLCLLKTQYGKFRQQTFVYTQVFEVLWNVPDLYYSILVCLGCIAITSHIFIPFP